jgi:hypothetical protein
MGSYAISDAAILERVSPVIRGRVIGLFITLAGTFASLSPWAMGFWTDLLRERAREPMAYWPIFATLGAMLLVASAAPRVIGRLSERQRPPAEPIPATRATIESA